MRKRLKQAAIVLVIVFAVSQLVRLDQANPPIDPNHTIRSQMGSAAAVNVIERSCSDCHSNTTAWPWYTQVAPVSWLMVYGVRKGRKVVNYSEWTTYPPELQRALLDLSCRDVSTNKMPGVYTLLHPEMRLSPQDVDSVCSAAREVEAGKPK